MESNISPSYYFSQQVFDQEKISVFQKNWMFAGFRSQLSNPNDFITRAFGDLPIVIQNVRGEIHAFLNVCSHRFSKIQTTECGNRPLVCPYHGWAYDQKGIPSGIPKRPMFKDFSQEELASMRLREYRVEFCGNLCFVSVDPQAISLKEFLGNFYSELESLSNSLGSQVDVNQMTIAANWKVIVENTLESYHVASIHTNTFKKLGAEGLTFDFTSKHSLWDASLSVKRSDSANKKIDELFHEPGYKIEGYKHILIYPNLLVSTTHGNSFNFSLIEPLSPTRTKFTSYVFTATPSATHKKALLSAFEKSLLDFNRQVFEEDKIICEAVQLGVAHATLQGVLSIEEERVHAFQKVYIDQMSSTR